MRESQTINDYTYLWYDVRPHPQFGTVEIRICDAQSTAEEVEALEALLESHGRKLDAVVSLDVDEEVVVSRMLARGRADDNEETIRTRLGVYREETFPLIEHYGDAIISIKAEGTVEEINARAMEALGK